MPRFNLIKFWTVVAALATTIRVCLLLYFSNCGFDIYDESFFVVMSKYPLDSLHTLYFYPLFSGILYSSLIDDLAAMRMLYYVLDTLFVALFAFLAVVFLKKEINLTRSESALVFVFILAASCLGLQERVINYNSLENWATLSIAGISLNLSSLTNRFLRPLLLLLVAFFFSVLLLVKVTSFISVFALWLIFIWINDKRKIHFLKTVSPVVVFSPMFSLAVLYAYSISIPGFIGEYKVGYEFNKMAGYGSGLWFLFCYVFNVFSFAIGVVVMLIAMGILYFFKTIPKEVKWITVSLVVCLYYFYPGPKDYDEAIFGWADLNRHNVIFICPTIALAFYFYYRHQFSLSFRERMLIILVLVLPIAAISISFLSIHFNLYSILAPWVLLFSIVVIFLLRSSAITAATVFISAWLTFTLYTTVRFQILEPKRLSHPLTEQNIPLPELNVMIDKETALLLAAKEKLTDPHAEVLALCNLSGIPLVAGLKPYVSSLFVTVPYIRSIEERNIRSNMSLLRRYYEPRPLYVVIKKSLMPHYSDSLAGIGISLSQDSYIGSYPFNFLYPTVEQPDKPAYDSVYVFYLNELN